MLDLDDIRAFAKIVEAGSLSRASALLGMSKSLLSRRRTRLERRLGMPLIARTTRGISVTGAGLNFKIHADRMLAEFQAGLDVISGERGLAGRLRIAAPLSFGVKHLAPLLAEFALAHPGLEIQTSYSDRLVDLVEEGYDMAIRMGDLPSSSLIARRIAPVRAFLVTSPSYLATVGALTHPTELVRCNLVAQGHETWRFRDGGRDIAIRPQGRFTADSGEALLAAVAAGLGFGMLPAFVAAPLLRSGAIVRALPEFPAPDTSLSLLRPPPGTHPPGYVTAVTEMLVAKFGGSRHWEGVAED